MQQATAKIVSSPLPFLGLCAYLLTQAHMIPLRAIGPSWAVWPRFADISFAILALLAVIAGSKGVNVSAANRRIFNFLVVGFGVCILSYFVVTIGMGGTATKGANDGIYYMYRVTQAIIIYWATMRITFTPKRLKILSFITTGVFIFVCTMCLLTKFRVVPTSLLAVQLPINKNVSGSWAKYFANMSVGWGTISYNHAYVSAQVILLLAVRMNLSRKRHLFTDSALILLAAVTCFISDSRAGLAALVLFAGMLFLRNWIYLIGIGALLLIGSFFFSPGSLQQNEDFEVVSERASGTLDPLKDQQFQARMQIWEGYLDAFQKEPHTWIVGRGFGSARSYGQPAHMMFLTIMSEIGIVGVSAFLLFFFIIITSLHNQEQPPQAMLYMTLALLASCMTQETLWPVPSMGHFVAFYLCAVAIALRVKTEGPLSTLPSRAVSPQFAQMPRMGSPRIPRTH